MVKGSAGAAGGEGEGKGMAGMAHTSMLWCAWVLEFCGWVILLSGVAALQQNCGASSANLVAGAAGYLAPVSCGKLYAYTWWTTFYEFFLVVLIPIVIAAGALGKFRAGLIGLIAPCTVLLMDTANTMLYFNSLELVSGTLGTRARVTLAGSIIAAIANFLKIILIGIHDEKKAFQQRIGAYKEPAPTAATTRGGVYIPAGTVPVSTATGTTTSVAPMRGGMPIATDVGTTTMVTQV